jgi:hypothetical protein
MCVPVPCYSDGTEGKTFLDLDLEKIQRTPETRAAWMDYSTYDTESTWQLREVLEKQLRQLPWTDKPGRETMWEFYWMYDITRTFLVSLA